MLNFTITCIVFKTQLPNLLTSISWKTISIETQIYVKREIKFNYYLSM